MSDHEELIGADYTEHNIHHPGVGVTRAVSVLKHHRQSIDLGLIPVGKNKGHMDYLEQNYATRARRPKNPNKVEPIIEETTVTRF